MVSLAAEDANLRLLDWKPKSQMVVSRTHIEAPRFPVIDIHNYLRNLDAMGQYLEEMEQARVQVCISLDGYSKDHFYRKHLARAKEVAPDRILVFWRPDWDRFDEAGFIEEEVRRLEEAVQLGARGMKIHKALGLTLKDPSGNHLYRRSHGQPAGGPGAGRDVAGRVSQPVCGY